VVTSAGLGKGPIHRPPAWRWILYAMGFGLPAKYDEWVFRDLTRRGWLIRELLRVEMLALPFIIGCLLLPARLEIRLCAAFFFVVGPPFVAGLYSGEWRDYRLRQHELLPPQVSYGPRNERKEP
jgi:hypothetical protein